MPDLSKLEIPEKQIKLRVSDDQIFRSLKNEHRTMGDRKGGAKKGDYLLIEAKDSRGIAKKIHLELGGKAYPQYQAALYGCNPGDERTVSVNGRETTIIVKTVRMPVELELTDESIASLNIPGVKTLVDYRRKHIDEHGGEIADRVFGAIRQKLFEQILRMAEIELDKSEVDHFNAQQLVMLEKISGNVDDRLLMAYGDNGARTLEECKQLFYEDNRESFLLYVWGRTLAWENGREPNEEEYAQALNYYTLIYEKTEDEIKSEGLMDDMLQPFYLQYGIGQLKEYYRSLVRFAADGIENYPII